MRIIAVSLLLLFTAMAGCLGDDEPPTDTPPRPSDPGGNNGGSGGGSGGGGSGGGGGGDPGTGGGDPADQNNGTSPPPQRSWPSLDNATIRPGVQVTSEQGQCTSNFVFTDQTGQHLFLGLAAHCFGTSGDSTNTNGCETGTAQHGAPVNIQGASQSGLLWYSSWVVMQSVNETDGNTCDYNDFALVWIHPDDRDKVHPAMLHFGGPTQAADPSSVSIGTRVLTFGNTGLRPGPEELDRREGRVVRQTESGWSTTVYTATPGVPGDSGSGVLTGDGQGLGILVTVGLAPLPASNGVTSLQHAVDYARSNGYGVHLATWEQISDQVV